MNIKIEDDVFDITKRIKEIDDGYYIEYNCKRKLYELHNFNQLNSYCLTIPFDNLDDRVLDLILYTNISNIDNIMIDINNCNTLNEINSQKIRKERSEFIVKEIYDFCNNSSKNFEVNSFENLWG